MIQPFASEETEMMKGTRGRWLNYSRWLITREVLEKLAL